MRVHATAPAPTPRQTGVVVVEAAIVLPLLLFLLLAIAEVGRALYQYNTLQKSVRDATRYVADNAIPNSTGVIDLTPALITTARNLAVYGNPNASGTPLLPGYTTGNVSVTSPDALHVRVSATYTYQPRYAVIPTFGLTDSGITMPTSLTAVLSMRAL